MSQAFSSNKCQDGRRYLKIFGDISVVFCATPARRKGNCSLFGATILYYYYTCNCKCTVYRCDMLPVKTRFKCGNYTLCA